MKYLENLRVFNLVNFIFIFLNICEFNGCKPASASQVLRPRGVSLAMAAFYDPDHPFTCFDGSGSVPFKYINDDYCDCKDGSDEPGTAACSSGTFHCNNVGYIGMDISSAYVNDGYCDCCDTSDEYKSDADCVDVCHSLGEAARAEARQRAEVEMEGFNRRQHMAEEGSRLKKEKEARIEELKKEKERAEIEQAEKSAAKEAAEEPEKEALQQYKAVEEEMNNRREKEKKEKDEMEAREAFTTLDSDGDGLITIEEIQATEIFDTNRDGSVSEDEAKFYLQQKESVDLETFLATGWALVRPTYTHQKRLFKPPPPTEAPEEEIAAPEEEEDLQNDPQIDDKEYNTDLDGQEEELEEESEDYADEEEDTEVLKEKDEAEKEEEEEKIVYDPETQRLVDLADAAREDYKKADEHLREIVREIQSLQDGLSKDFGRNEEFRVLEGQCYQFTDREYIYELCPFNNALQKPKSGHGDTRLGTWGQWAGPPNNPYGVMKYTGGQACWNGPQRSAEVRLSCGTENELTAVSEPSRCEYLFLFTTPAVCSQPDESGSIHQHEEL